MPTQFFKDVHSGLSNKFTSRTIALQVNNTREKDDSSDSIAGPGSPMSANAAHSSSFTSVGSFSKIFGECDHSGKGSSGSLKELELGDPSSIDEIVPGSKASTQKIYTNPNSDEKDEDDEVQITEVREVSRPDAGTLGGFPGYRRHHFGMHRFGNEEPSDLSDVSMDYGDTNDQSSGDLMMEALFKSQKYTTVLKKNLEAANAKVVSQDLQISKGHRKIHELKDLFRRLKDNLALLEQKSSEMKDSRSSDNETIITLKEELKSISEVLSTYKREVSLFKKQIDQLKKIKVSTSYEIEKRNKDISVLQKRLDEKSGLLSEQKIKTLDLEKLLEASRKQYDESISKIMNSSIEFQTSFTQKMDTSYQELTHSIHQIFRDDTSSIIAKTEKNIDTKIEGLGKSFSETLQLSCTSLSKQVLESVKESSECISSLLQRDNDLACQSLNEIKENQNSAISDLNKIGQLVQKTDITISDKKLITESFQTVIGPVEVRIDELGKAIKDKHDLTLTIEQLRNANKDLELDAVTNKGKIEEMEATILLNQTTIDDCETRIGELKTQCESYVSEMNQLKDTIASGKIKLKESEEEIVHCKAECQKKLETQLNSYHIVCKERDESQYQLNKQQKEMEELIKIQTFQIDSLRKQNSSLYAEIEKVTKTTDHQKELLNGTKKENVELKQQIEALNAQQDQAIGFNLHSSTPSRTLKRSSTSRKRGLRPVKEPETKDHNLSDLLNDSMIDISLDFKPTTITKTTSIKTKNEKSTAAQSSAKSKLAPPAKRKKLFEDHMNVVDDFDLDDELSELPIISRRYTKKNKN